jgi:hypothetical protein
MRANCPVCKKRVPVTDCPPGADYSPWIRRHCTGKERQLCRGSFMAVEASGKTSGGQQLPTTNAR